MNARTERRRTTTRDVADEALRYLRVVDGFAELDADLHADARSRAASARMREDPALQQAGRPAARKAVFRWRS